MATRKREAVVAASQGDLEVLLLLENQRSFAGVTSPNLYKVVGEAPRQLVSFHNIDCFDLFLVRVNELIAESPRVLAAAGGSTNHSLLSATQAFCGWHSVEADAVGLTPAIVALAAWLNAEQVFRFWCSPLGKNVELRIAPMEQLSFVGTLAKHNLLRLAKLLDRFRRILDRHGYDVAEAELIAVLDPFEEQLRERIWGYSSYLAELLFDYFAAVNRIVSSRFLADNTNDVSKMRVPSGVTSDALRNAYGDALVFWRLDESSYTLRRPATSGPPAYK
ncbi:MAG TPA: hypothetical protein VGJ82_17305 [Thermoanaerobaculia bacterium]|jgi:hypothetical protein